MNTQINDQHIVEAIKRGNVKAFDSFYSQYASAFYGDIKKTLLQEDVSEQTLIQVFMNIWSNIDKYNPDNEKFFLWTLKIAKKEIRKRKTEIVIEELFSCQRSTTNGGISPNDLKH